MAQPSSPPTYDDAVSSKNAAGQFLNQPQQEFSQAPEAPHLNPSGQPGYPPPVSGGVPVNPAVYPMTLQQQPYSGSGYENPNFTNANVAYLPPPVESTPSMHASSADAEASGFTVRGSFSDKDVRRLFIRKVFITLGLQLLFTFGIVCVFTLVPSVVDFVKYNPAIYYTAYGVFIVLYFVLVCSVNASRKHPCNLIMLCLLTLALSYMTGTISSFYEIQAVMIALAITVGVCLTVILFSMQTKYDFTKCGGLIFILVMVLFVFGFVTIFTYWRPWYVQVVYGMLGALVFTLFLAFDTQLVMGGRKYELDPEEHIFGALVLYIDVIYIFLFILSIFGGSSN